MLIDGSYTNLLQGISQQPDSQKLVGQCNDMQNMSADIVDGLKRRPGTKQVPNSPLVGTLNLNTDVGKFYHYDTGEEQYWMLWDNGVRVFDFEGNEYTVNISAFGDPLAYLESYDPKRDYSITTIGDYTLIANRKITTSKRAEVKSQQDSVLIVLTQAGDFGMTYSIEVDGINRAEYSTPPVTDTEATGYETDAHVIMAALASDLEYYYNVVNHTDNVISIEGEGLQNSEVVFKDARSDGTGVVISTTVKSTGSLPKYAKPGHVVQVTGDGTRDINDYYLEAVPVQTGFSFREVVWRETTAPGMQYRLEPDSMPHALIRLSDGTFFLTAVNGTSIYTAVPGGGWFGGSVDVQQWSNRSSGDDTSNPFKLFVGGGIDFIGSFQERLVLISGEILFLSSLDGFFDFFNKTALTLLDTDPIELANPSTKISKLRTAVTHDKNLVVFSASQQFVLPGGAELTPSRAALQVITDFNASLNAEPVAVGNTVLFDISYGKSSGIRELFTDTQNAITDARSITDHVRNLIPGDIHYMAVGSNVNMVGVLSTDDPNAVYVYQHLWSEEQRVQSAWSRWDFPYQVHRIMFSKERMLIIMKDLDQQVILCTMDIADAPEPGINFPLYLDTQDTATPDVNLQFFVPDLSISTDNFMVIQGANAKYPGTSLQFSVSGQVVTLNEDPEGTVIYGHVFNSSYDPMMPMMKDQNGVAIRTNRLIVNSFNIMFSAAGVFYFDVKDEWNGVRTQTFDSRILGNTTTVFGEQPVIPGVFNAGVSGDRDQVTARIWTAHFTPLRINDIEWTGQFTKRGRRF